jgi:hypothetical protein
VALLGPVGAAQVSVRAVLGRALAAALVHALLLAAWPLVAPAYAPAFRAGHELALGFIGPLSGELEIRLEPGSDGPMGEDMVRMDTIVGLRPRTLAGPPATFGASSFFHGWWALSVLCALFVAALPRPWRARRRPFLWALVLLHLGLALRILPSLYYCCTQCSIDGRPMLDLGAGGVHALYMLKHLTWNEVLPNYLGPLLVFALCAFGPRSRAVPTP